MKIEIELPDEFAKDFCEMQYLPSPAKNRIVDSLCRIKCDAESLDRDSKLSGLYDKEVLDALIEGMNNAVVKDKPYIVCVFDSNGRIVSRIQNVSTLDQGINLAKVLPPCKEHLRYGVVDGVTGKKIACD